MSSILSYQTAVKFLLYDFHLRILLAVILDYYDYHLVCGDDEGVFMLIEI